MKPIDIFRLFTSSSALIFLLMGCYSKHTQEPVSGETNSVKVEVSTKEQSSTKKHESWSYSDSTGPKQWSTISPEYSVASTGKEQSPINIVTSDCTPSNLPQISYIYNESNVNFFNNGHTVQANLYNNENYITIGEHRYDLSQFHFHTKSENTIDGIHSPVEMHMVHKDSTGSLAVIGVLFKEGAENLTLKDLWDNLPQKETSGYYTSEKVSIAQLLPKNRSAYRFDGSLTTPPCTEGVTWTVMVESLEMSEKQIAALAKMFSGKEFPEGNRRPVQPLNQRKIVLALAQD